jgi:hypothetical protein
LINSVEFDKGNISVPISTDTPIGTTVRHRLPYRFSIKSHKETPQSKTMLRHRPDRRRSAPVAGSAAQHESWRKDGLEEIKDPLARTLKRAPILRPING